MRRFVVIAVCALAACSGNAGNSDGGGGGGGGGSGGSGGGGGGTQLDGGGGGTGGGSGGGSGGGAAGCHWVASGDSSGSGGCMVQAGYSSSKNAVVFTIDDGNTLAFAADLLNHTTLANGTYTLADAPTAGSSYVVNTTSAWAMCNNNGCTDGAGNTIPNYGTFTLTVTDPGPATAGILWRQPHGSVELHLPSVPHTTSSGNVLMNVTF